MDKRGQPGQQCDGEVEVEGNRWYCGLTTGHDGQHETGIPLKWGPLPPPKPVVPGIKEKDE